MQADTVTRDRDREGAVEGDQVAAATATALRSPDDVAHNLPVQLTSFIGRDAEMMQVRALLAGSRLVTLTGAGGVGKTRLALQIAAGLLAEFPAGVWQVDLAPLTDATLVAVTVARAVGLAETPGLSAMAIVIGFIGARRALIVRENCEHLLDACAALAEKLLGACPGLVILATSREPVGVDGEATWRVPSLPVDGAAIELFADRGQRGRPGFAVTPENAEAVAEICRRLDGIPLSIELAAARLRAFSPAEIAARLHDRFRLLTGGSRTAARRQQTLRASMDWSHALLTEPERLLFRRLAAFAGGFDLEAAEAIGAGDGLDPGQVLDQLALLVDKSLVAAEESDGATRYRLLETVRQYALEKLVDSGEADEVRTRHCGHYTAMAARLDPPADGDPRRRMGRLETDIDNLRAAFQWSLELSDSETALRLASSLQPLWLGRCRMLEGLAWFDAALAGQPAGAEPVAPEVRVRALADAVVLDAYTATPRRLGEAKEAVAWARQLGDPALLGRALFAAGCAAGHLGVDGRPYLEEAIMLARQAGDTRTLAGSLARQAFVAAGCGDPVAARSAAEEGPALAEQVGNDHIARSCRTWLSAALIEQGELHPARSILTGLISEAEAAQAALWKLYGVGLLGRALAHMGQPDEARAAGKASIAIADDLGLAAQTHIGYTCLALAAMAAGDLEALREACQAGWHRMNTRPEYGVKHQINMAEYHLAAADIPAARQWVGDAIAAATTRGMKSTLMSALLTSARVAATEGDVGHAHSEVCHALSIGRGFQAALGIAEGFECLGGLAQGAEDHHKAARLLGAADAIRQKAGSKRLLLYQACYEAAVLALRSTMGDEAFGRAWDEGTALTLGDAVNYALRGRGERSRPAVGWLSLTPAERDVARLVAEGLSNKDIAARLFVSPRTVQTHLTHIYRRVGVTSRVQLAQQAARQS